MKNIKSALLLILLLAVISEQIVAQKTVDKDSSVQALLNRIPLLPGSALEIHALYYPKAKASASPSKLFAAELRRMVMSLYIKSNKQSRLLLMITGEYDNGPRPDFTKVKINRDKQLEAVMEEAKINYFRASDDFNRSLGTKIDSTWKTYKGVELAEAQWRIYKKELQVFISELKKSQFTLIRYMKEKGFTLQLQDGNQNFPYYIQALEAEGLIIDRLIRLAELIDGTEATIALLVENCKLNPDQCK